MSTRTADEIISRWHAEPRELAALEVVLQRYGRPDFAAHLVNHNPIYFLAENLFFDNVRKDKAYLYPPLHRDIFSKAYLDYALRPKARAKAGLLLMAQRESFKSTFAHGVVPMFLTLRDFHLFKRHRRIALVHQKELQAAMNARRLKRKAMSHPWMRKVWSEYSAEKDFGTQLYYNWPAVPDRGEAAEYSILAASLGADFTGLHFDDIFFSDLVIKDHITSKVKRVDTEMRHEAMLYTVDMAHGKSWYDGTRYHVNDLWGKMLKSGMYEVVMVAARLRDGTLTHPYRHTEDTLRALQALEIKRTGNDFMFWLQMMNEPKHLGMVATDPSWIKNCRQIDVHPNSWRCIFVDPAWKGTDNHGEGDWASIQVWAFVRHGAFVYRYLVDGVHSNMLTDRDGLNIVFSLMRQYNVQHVAPEEIGGYSFRQNLIDEARIRGQLLEIVKLKSMQTNKDLRIATFVGECQAERVYVCEEADETLSAAFMNQFTDWPQLDVDDAIDCGAYTSDEAVRVLYAPRFNTAAFRPNRAPIAPRRTRYCIN